MAKFKHGMIGTPTYRSWASMVTRCRNPNSTQYAYYGGRGITVCERWLDFRSFLEDMGERPAGTSIDRIDNSRNYEPGNCKWATRAEQNRNRRDTKLSAADVEGLRSGIVSYEAVMARTGASLSAVRRAKHGQSWGERAGRRHGLAKLTQDQAGEIRASAAATRDLAARFGVSLSLIRRVRSGKAYA